ncbi:MAG: hypothetical protein ACFCUI_01485 [Bernardetiaceae bacterium]
MNITFARCLYWFLGCWLCCSAWGGLAQPSVKTVFDTIDVHYIREFDFKKRFDGELLLQFHYGRTTIENAQDVALLKGRKITAVQLLYSWYPTGSPQQEERQRALNLRRTQQLHRLLPDLFLLPNVRWELIAQTNCSSPAAARNLFHGFVIQYRPE